MSLCGVVSSLELCIEDYTPVEINEVEYYFRYDGDRFSFYKKIGDDRFELTDCPRGEYDMNDLIKLITPTE